MEWRSTEYVENGKRTVLHWPYIPGRNAKGAFYVLEEDGKFIVRRSFSAQKNDQECPTLEAAKVAAAMLSG